MKKTLAFLAALAVSLLSLSASAQDKQVFNHVALGVSAGIDGFGVEAVLPATPYLQIRGGYSIMPFTYTRNVNLGQFDMPDGTKLDLNNIPLSASLWKGGLGKVLLDIYPGKGIPFRIVAGAFIGNGKLIGATMDLSKAIPQSYYQTGIGRNNVTISTDGNGKAYADAAVMKVLPYLGLGFGRCLDPKKRVAFSFELGVVYSGGIKPTLYDYSDPAGVQSSVITSKDLVMDDGKQLDNGIIDKVSGIPVLPMMKLGLYVRLF